MFDIFFIGCNPVFDVMHSYGDDCGAVSGLSGFAVCDIKGEGETHRL